MTPKEIIIIVCALFIVVILIKLSFDDKKRRERIMRDIQARKQNRARIQQELNQAHSDLREVLLGESYNNTKDESKEIERLKAQNKKLIERINYLENKGMK